MEEGFELTFYEAITEAVLFQHKIECDTEHPILGDVAYYEYTEEEGSMDAILKNKYSYTRIPENGLKNRCSGCGELGRNKREMGRGSP